MPRKPLPIGIDDFARLIDGGYYYVDKTLLIKDLLDNRGLVTLFTRPRRFGKTLNMSMLKYFFEAEVPGTRVRSINGSSPATLFAGLNIAQAGERYTAEMGKYPVIFLTLKEANKSDFAASYYAMTKLIAKEYERHAYVLEGDALSPRARKLFCLIADGKAERADMYDSLLFLCECLAVQRLMCWRYLSP